MATIGCRVLREKTQKERQRRWKVGRREREEGRKEGKGRVSVSQQAWVAASSYM